MKILVAEDDAATRHLLCATIASWGHDCVEAVDGNAGWQAFQQHEPDVVITDRNMPGMDGLALCTSIRDHPQGVRTSIILVTAEGAASDVVAGVEAGADDYLVKPVEPFALRVRLLAAERVAALHRQLEAARTELERHNQELEVTARTDALTGVGNRRRFEEDLAAAHAQAERAGQPYAVALVDVDHFKAYNDDFGHPAGDRALQAVAGALVDSCRRGDTVYRYGGEEFVVIYRHSDPPAVAAAAERARSAVAGLVSGGAPDLELERPLSVSLGLAWPAPDSVPDDVVSAADAALYRAKAGGRDRVVLMSPIAADHR